ncbi:MAG: undecaprenyl/decaprenyl-phosphate alpha-N-acetylglucosaminyl 1-phosphate transferase [Bacteroidales bacterium]|nr:undecaprenyl/decaprenyl-phosphate alpha-N-acetylglucosaminyl 1-phosphate transferase [Bacteroidales bacterium]
MNTYSILVFGGVIFLLSIVLFYALYKFSGTLRIQNDLSEQRWSLQSKPTVGGIGFFIMFTIILFYSYLFKDNFTVFSSLSFNGFLLAAFLSFVTGLVDDAKKIKPIVKFLMQTLIAFVLVFSGNMIHFFEIYILDFLLTYFWIVGLMNAINFLDNMDGVASLLTIGIVLSIIILSLFSTLNESTIFIFTGVIGFLLAFLLFNFPPAKYYMGDNGSLFLGLLVSYAGIEYVWNNFNLKQLGFFPHLSIIWLVYLWPITDIFLVTIRRLFLGKMPWHGGKDHTNHHLIYLGLNEKQVNIFIIFYLILINLILLLITQLKGWNAFIWLGILSFSGAFTLFFFVLLFFIVKNDNEKK